MRGSAINKHTLSWCLAALCVIKIILDYELSTNPLYVLKSYKFSKEFAVKARLQERQRIFDALYGEQNRLDWLGNAYGDLFRESARNFKRFRRPHRQEVEDFVEQRDRGWRRQGDESSFASCGNCVLNASCYDATKSLWHPSKCSSNSGLFQFKPGNVASSHERCSNLSLVFLGDSRARYLFSAVMRRFYPEWIKIHR